MKIVPQDVKPSYVEGAPHAPDPALITALAHADAGVAVLPVEARGKIPLTRHGVDDATTDRRSILRWARHWPGCNWGARCDSDRIIIDADKPEALALIRSLNLPKAPTVYTARGRHLVYHYSGELPAKLRNEAGDVVGDVKRNGYVLLPGSVHPSGKAYRVGPGYSVFGPELPERCAQRIRELDRWSRPELPPMPEGDAPEHWRAYGVTLLSSLAATMRSKAPDSHERNDTLNYVTFRAAQHSASCSISREDARAAIVVAAKATGLPRREIARTFSGAWSDGIAQPVTPKPRRDSDIDAQVAERRAFVNSAVFPEGLGRGWRSCRTVALAQLDEAERVGSLTIAPGIGRLVILTGLSEKTVRRALARMAEVGLITLVESGRFDRNERGRLVGIPTRWSLDPLTMASNGLTEQVTSLQTNEGGTDSATNQQEFDQRAGYRAVTYSERVAAPCPARCDAAVHPLSVAFDGPVAAAWRSLENRDLAARGQLGADIFEALARRGGEAIADEIAADVGCTPRTARKHLNETTQVVGQRQTTGRPATVYGLPLSRDDALGVNGPVCRALAEKRAAEVVARRKATASRIRRGLPLKDAEADAYAKAEYEMGEWRRRLRDVIFTTEPEPGEWEYWRLPPAEDPAPFSRVENGG